MDEGREQRQPSRHQGYPQIHTSGKQSHVLYQAKVSLKSVYVCGWNDKLMRLYRPGLSEFLEQVSKLYELHIYTMGTRHYAEAVAREIDPEDKLFRDRILSRDESGSTYQRYL